jgi:hypothetical protein
MERRVGDGAAPISRRSGTVVGRNFDAVSISVASSGRRNGFRRRLAKSDAESESRKAKTL